MNCVPPFTDSDTLAQWTAAHLAERDIDAIVKWRMLEQWMQTELFRSIECNDNVAWSHLGEGEQPYWSNLPKNQCKPNSIPRIDLVFAHPQCDTPSQIVWLELKHIGRNQKNLRNNSCGLGPDLVALYAIDPAKTKSIWLAPPPVVVNESKVELWKKYGQNLDRAEHFYAQIVLAKKELVDVPGNEEMVRKNWLGSFERRSGVSAESLGLKIARADTRYFSIFALVGKVGLLGEPKSPRPITSIGAAKYECEGVTTNCFSILKSLGIDRRGEEPGTPVKISWIADGHIVELHYKYKVGWNFDGFVLDGRFFPLPGVFEKRKSAEDFYLGAAYRYLQRE